MNESLRRALGDTGVGKDSDRLMTFRVLPSTHEDLLLNYRMQLQIDLQGLVLQATCNTDTFGYDAEQLLGHSFGAFLQGTEEEYSQVLLELLLRQQEGERSLRVGWRLPSGVFTSAVLQPERSSDMVLLMVYRTDLLEAYLTVDMDTGSIRKTSEMVGKQHASKTCAAPFRPTPDCSLTGTPAAGPQRRRDQGQKPAAAAARAAARGPASRDAPSGL